MLEYDKGLDLFAPSGVWDSDGAGFKNAGVFIQCFVDIAGVNIETTGYDHVFFSVHNIEIPILIHGGDIAGIQPAVTECIGCFIGSFPVSGHDLGAAYDQFTLFPNGHIGETFSQINQTDVGVRIRNSDAPGFLNGMIGVRMGVRRCLRKSETFVDPCSALHKL